MRTNNLRSPLAVGLLAAAAVAAVVLSPTAGQVAQPGPRVVSDANIILVSCAGVEVDGACIGYSSVAQATAPSTQGKAAVQAAFGSTADTGQELPTSFRPPATSAAKPAASRSTRSAAARADAGGVLDGGDYKINFNDGPG